MNQKKKLFKRIHCKFFSKSEISVAGQSKRKQTTAAKAIQTGLSRRGGPKVETNLGKSESPGYSLWKQKKNTEASI